jgi:hypothetical protein
MVKRIVVVVLLVAALAGAVLLYTNPFSKYKSSVSPFSAIPKSVGVFTFSNNVYQFLDKADTVNFAALMGESLWMPEFKRNLDFLEKLSIALDSSGTFNFSDDIVFGYSNTGSGKLGILNIISLKEGLNDLNFDNLTALFKEKNIKTGAYSFDNTQIFSIEKFMNESTFTFTIHKNLLIGSFYPSLVEESVMAIKSGESLKSESLQTLMKNHRFEGDLNIFFNLKTAQNYAPILLNNPYLYAATGFKNMGEWMGLEINLAGDKVLFNGYTSFSKSDSTLLSRLSASYPVEKTIAEVLPANTAYLSFTASSDETFFATEDIELSYFSSWVDEQYAYFSLEAFDEDFMKRSGLAVKAKDIDLASENLREWNETWQAVDSLDNHLIYELKSAGILEKAFPNGLMKFSNLVVGFLNGYVIFAQDASVIKTCIQKFYSGSTLHRDLDYIDFSEKISSRSNHFVYCNPSLWIRPLETIFKDKALSPKGIQSFYIQLSNVNNAFFTTGAIHYGTKQVTKTNKLWEVNLDTVAVIKPQLVVNHLNRAKEIITQDAHNQIYLMNASGEILFKIPLSGRIIGKVYQIDFYNNKKLQYVFSTEDKIFVVDRTGKSVADFPLNLPATAVNGITVVNYDKSNNYRFFIACNNQKVYGYEHAGKPLPGWSPLGEVGMVNTSISHGVIGDKDYIYFTNSVGHFYALDRKGEQRFKPVEFQTEFKQNFILQKDEFVNGANGRVYKVNKNGAPSSFEVLDSSYHHFIPVKSLLRNENMFAFASKNDLALVKSQVEKLASYSVPYEIVSIESLVLSKTLWFLIKTAEMVYLVDELGSLHPDFPVATSADVAFFKLFDGKEEVFMYQDNSGKLQVLEIKFAN